jgi:hypothetical protein
MNGTKQRLVAVENEHGLDDAAGEDGLQGGAQTANDADAELNLENMARMNG